MRKSLLSRIWRYMDKDSGISSNVLSQSDNQNDVENNQNDDNSDNANDDANQNQTYTKEQYDNALKKAKKQAEKQILDELGIKDINSAKENINKYLESIEKDKSDLQKANEKVKSNASEINQLKQENVMLLLVNKSLMAGVKPDNAEDFAAIVKSRISEDEDADDIIKELKKNSAYVGFFNNVEKEKKPNGTGNPLGKQRNNKGETINYGQYLAEKIYGKSRNKEDD